MSSSLNAQEPLQQPWVAESALPKKNSYAPLFETLRLYAGWVLFWAGVLLVMMAYGEIRQLPFKVPYIQDIAQIRSIVVVACASFLFLLLSRLHGLLKSGFALGIGLTVVWALCVLFVMQNV